MTTSPLRIPFPKVENGTRREPAPKGNSFLTELIACAENSDAKQEQPKSNVVALKPAPAAEKAPAAAAKVPAAPPQLAMPGLLSRTWSWLHGKCTLSSTRQLRVTETVSLGEKRFVAVVHVEGRRFLIGGGASGVSLLTHLGQTPDEAASAPGTAEGLG